VDANLPVEINQNDIDSVNAYFKNKVFIIKQAFRIPEIKVCGDYDLGEYKDEVEKERRELEIIKRPNDMHAVLHGEPKWDKTPVVMQVKRIDYAGLTVLRKKGVKPKVITSNVLVVCSESGEVILHERSKSVDTEKGKIHFFGGGHMPGRAEYNDEIPRADDCESLTRTAEREFEEASAIKIAIPEDTPMLLVEDNACPEMPFIQLNYLVRDISKVVLENGLKLFDRKKESAAADNYSWEGNPDIHPFSELLNDLECEGFEDSKFALSGKAHLLMWLALGCPGIHDKNREWDIGPRVQKARGVFDRIVKRRSR